MSVLVSSLPHQWQSIRMMIHDNFVSKCYIKGEIHRKQLNFYSYLQALPDLLSLECFYQKVYYSCYSCIPYLYIGNCYGESWAIYRVLLIVFLWLSINGFNSKANETTILIKYSLSLLKDCHHYFENLIFAGNPEPHSW